MSRSRFDILILTTLFAAACGGGGRPTGPAVPVPDTIRTVQGQIGYYTTGPRLSNRTSDGRLIPVPGLLIGTLPARGPHLPVEIRAPNGTLLAETVTGSDGSYSIDVNFGKNPATQVIVRTVARLDLPGGTVVRVLPDELATQEYSYQTAPSGNPDDRTMTIDLAVPLDQGAGAYRMLTVLYPAFLIAAQGLLGGELRDLDLLWSLGNGIESSFDGSDPAKAHITVAGGITGDPTSNHDEWDECKVVRLMGEYLLYDHFHEVAPKGLVTDGSLVPSSAWREGFLDFWSCAARSDRLYWETEGEGASGRVVRFFDIESFFDPSLGSLGADDPNVYQRPEVTGIASRFTVAEVLWDIHDTSLSDDGAGLGYPLFLTLRFLEAAQPGVNYPYLVTLIEEYDEDNSISKIKMDNLLRAPENQNIPLLSQPLSPLVQWPRWFSPGGATDKPVDIGFTGQMSDTVDTINPVPPNPDIGDGTQRYFTISVVVPASITARITTTGELRVEILDLFNNVLGSATDEVTVGNLPAAQYVIRVLPTPAASPQTSDFDLDVEVGNP